MDGEPSTDILDIWLDSGLSWSIALDNGQSSAVLEGIDQINAWFQTSLLTSVALQGKAPFKEVIFFDNKLVFFYFFNHNTPSLSNYIFITQIHSPIGASL